MVRKQIYIEDRQEALLKRLSARLRISEAQLIRQGIDRCVEGEIPRERRLKAWKEIQAFIGRRMAQGTAPQSSRAWTRQELYDERWDRRRAK